MLNCLLQTSKWAIAIILFDHASLFSLVTECTISLALEDATLQYQKCAYNDSVSDVVTNLSGYLYPLTIEFNILIGG